jgi:hypothetical protein
MAAGCDPYFSICTTLITGCTLYTTSGATTVVSNGYYSDGTSCFTVTSGIITSISSCPTPTPTPTPTATATPTPTPTPTVYAISWSFTKGSNAATFVINVNSSPVVNVTATGSGSFNVNPGDDVDATVTGTATIPLTSQSCLDVIDDVTSLYSNCSNGAGSPSVSSETYGTYVPSANGSITASTSEF